MSDQARTHMTVNRELLLDTLVTAQASAVTLAASLDVVIKVLLSAREVVLEKESLPETVNPEVSGESKEEEAPPECRHPVSQRVSAAVMGHQSRFLCNVCKKFIEE